MDQGAVGKSALFPASGVIGPQLVDSPPGACEQRGKAASARAPHLDFRRSAPVDGRGDVARVSFIPSPGWLELHNWPVWGRWGENNPRFSPLTLAKRGDPDFLPISPRCGTVR